RVGERNVLLAFLAEDTLRGEHLPAHGARGPGHFALGIAAEALDSWRRRLPAHGVAIEQEGTWPRGGRALYFRDPARHLGGRGAPPGGTGDGRYLGLGGGVVMGIDASSLLSVGCEKHPHFPLRPLICRCARRRTKITGKVAARDGCRLTGVRRRPYTPQLIV